MSKKQVDKKEEVQYRERGYGTCGAPHGDCPNTWKGSCDREAGHEGSHHCDGCHSAF